jgi:hypothetical protein
MCGARVSSFSTFSGSFQHALSTLLGSSKWFTLYCNSTLFFSLPRLSCYLSLLREPSPCFLLTPLLSSYLSCYIKARNSPYLGAQRVCFSSTITYSSALQQLAILAFLRGASYVIALFANRQVRAPASN